jgi:monooxygenase
MTPDHVDVVIVGAGLSGIGAAHHLQERCPGRTYAILESRDAIGGTWDLFRYPGIRSDSDMYTLGYVFKPWTEAKSIADGPAILSYVREVAADSDIEPHIRFNHRVVGARWCSAAARWTVEAQRTDTNEVVELTCNFLLSCSGYYRYDEGYTPDFPGRENFKGEIVHPQHWPADLDYTGKRVVVIGSGATAVTIVPAMAHTATHVTMLQRSPSYVLSLPAVDPIADFVRRFLPTKLAYSIVRWKNVMLGSTLYNLSRKRPTFMRKLLRKLTVAQLPEGYDVDTHFNPRYKPWDQRMCLVPNADLFEAISNGSASVVTDTVDTFTETGVRLGSGEELEADVVVTATGLNMLVFGGIELRVDDQKIELPDTMAYRGTMISGVPNYAYTIGYTNASWTLKADLTCQYVCRLLNHMRERGYDTCTPVNNDPTVVGEPLLDFSSGYVQRSIHLFPKNGSREPWKLRQSYPRDVLSLRYGQLEDGAIRFGRIPLPAQEQGAATVAA